MNQSHSTGGMQQLASANPSQQQPSQQQPQPHMQSGSNIPPHSMSSVGQNSTPVSCGVRPPSVPTGGEGVPATASSTELASLPGGHGQAAPLQSASTSGGVSSGSGSVSMTSPRVAASSHQSLTTNGDPISSAQNSHAPMQNPTQNEEVLSQQPAQQQPVNKSLLSSENPPSPSLPSGTTTAHTTAPPGSPVAPPSQPVAPPSPPVAPPSPPVAPPSPPVAHHGPPEPPPSPPVAHHGPPEPPPSPPVAHHGPALIVCHFCLSLIPASEGCICLVMRRSTPSSASKVLLVGWRVKLAVRQQIIIRMLRDLYPVDHYERAVQDPQYMELVRFCQKIEKDFLNSCRSKEEYYTKLADKMSQVQVDINRGEYSAEELEPGLRPQFRLMGHHPEAYPLQEPVHPNALGIPVLSQQPTQQQPVNKSLLSSENPPAPSLPSGATTAHTTAPPGPPVPPHNPSQTQGTATSVEGNDQQKTRLIQQQLVLLLHAYKCLQRERDNPTHSCTLQYCRTMKDVLRHMMCCQESQNCQFSHCVSSRQIIMHWKQCGRADCTICMPIKGVIKPANSDSWHSHVLPAVRQQIIRRMLQKICPVDNYETAVQDPQYMKLVRFFQKIEEDLFNSCRSKEEYYTKLADKTRQVVPDIHRL